MRYFSLGAAFLLACVSPDVALARSPIAPAVDAVVLGDRDLRVIDIAKLAPSDAAANLVVARLRKGATLALSQEERGRLLHRRVPGRDLTLRQSGMMRFTAPAAPRLPAPACFALNAPLDQGEYLDSGRVSTVPCAPTPTVPLRHDPSAGAPFAKIPLAAGTYLGRVALREGRVAHAGSTMRLVAVAGPVVIEREVRTLQPARAGQSVFVATGDGAVTTSRLVMERHP